MLIKEVLLRSTICGVVLIIISSWTNADDIGLPLPEDGQEVKLKKQSVGEQAQQIQALLTALNKPKKSEPLQLKGWSASGMPFNVLYSPNALQQRLLTSGNHIQHRVPPIPTPLPLRRDIPVDRKEDKIQYLRPRVKQGTKTAPSRKHYLVIPQLFVSYGWGPVGK